MGDVVRMIGIVNGGQRMKVMERNTSGNCSLLEGHSNLWVIGQETLLVPNTHIHIQSMHSHSHTHTRTHAQYALT